MAREKENYRLVLAHIADTTGKMELGVYDVMKYMGIGYAKASKEYMDGKKKITAHKLANKLL